MNLFFTKFEKLDPDPHSFYLLDPDPHSEKLLDPDPQKWMRIHSTAGAWRESDLGERRLRASGRCMKSLTWGRGGCEPRAGAWRESYLGERRLRASGRCMKQASLQGSVGSGSSSSLAHAAISRYSTYMLQYSTWGTYGIGTTVPVLPNRFLMLANSGFRLLAGSNFFFPFPSCFIL